MDCQHAFEDEIAERYLKGQLDAALQDEFEVHLIECPRCREQVEAISALTSVLKEQAHEIRLKQPATRMPFRWVTVAAAAVVLVIGAFAVVQLLQWHRPEKIIAQPPNVPSEVRRPTEPMHPTPEVSTTAKREPTEIIAGQSRTAKSTSKAAQTTPPAGLQLTSPVPSPDPLVVAQMPEQKPRAAVERRPVREAQAALTQEQGAELFRLGLVEPPTYTFSGFGAEANPSAGGATVKGYSGAAPKGSARALFQKGMLAYVERRYRDAAENLEGAADAEPGAPDVNFYLGICRLVEGRPVAAVQSLKKVVANSKSPLVQSAHFYLAKAYIQANDLAAAEAELQASAAMPGDMKSQAATLLSRLQAFRAQLPK